VTLRLSKILLLAGVSLLHTLIVFNNTTDYFSNFQFVRHVLAMDTTFPGNDGMWRAIRSPLADHLFYVAIIVWETAVMILGWAGVAHLGHAWRASVTEFNRAKRMAVIALTLSLLLWLVAFLAVGGEWFLMWQSKVWDGQQAAARMFAVVGIVFLLLAMPDTDAQP
jgi:predicted small integral membrane protein